MRFGTFSLCTVDKAFYSKTFTRYPLPAFVYSEFIHQKDDGPRSAGGNMSGNRCESACTSRGR